MSPRSVRALLWLGLALMAPLPVFAGVATGLMPVARMAMLAGLCGLVVLLENANGAVGLLCLMFLAQAVVYLQGRKRPRDCGWSRPCPSPGRPA